MSLLQTITAPAISAASSGFLSRAPHGHLIGGVWQVGGDTFDTLDPATGDVLASVARGDAGTVDSAVDLAELGFAIALHPLVMLHGFIRQRQASCAIWRSIAQQRKCPDKLPIYTHSTICWAGCTMARTAKGKTPNEDYLCSQSAHYRGGISRCCWL
jgi:hypothetical protein